MPQRQGRARGSTSFGAMFGIYRVPKRASVTRDILKNRRCPCTTVYSSPEPLRVVSCIPPTYPCQYNRNKIAILTMRSHPLVQCHRKDTGLPTDLTSTFRAPLHKKPNAKIRYPKTRGGQMDLRIIMDDPIPQSPAVRRLRRVEHKWMNAWALGRAGIVRASRDLRLERWTGLGQNVREKGTRGAATQRRSKIRHKNRVGSGGGGTYKSCETRPRLVTLYHSAGMMIAEIRRQFSSIPHRFKSTRLPGHLPQHLR
jgi:hypothetical protein